jgi:hypothetical protein
VAACLLRDELLYDGEGLFQVAHSLPGGSGVAHTSVTETAQVLKVHEQTVAARLAVGAGLAETVSLTVEIP